MSLHPPPPTLAAAQGGSTFRDRKGSDMSAFALVVAAGRGTRAGGGVPKQYQDLGGSPVLAHSVRTLTAHPDVNAVRVVIHPDDRAFYAFATEGLQLMEPVAGGETRQESVRMGLDSLAGSPPDAVLIHDAARPLVSPRIVTETLAALTRFPGAVAAVPVRDTLKRAREGNVLATVKRSELWRAQTPQAFRYAGILAAHHSAAGMDLTDDAAVAETAGLTVTLVEDSEDNAKITSAEDLARAARLLAAGLGDVRVGSGIDVHRFGPGDAVVLCGVRIPHSHGLVGHSDADLGLHAVADALLSAVGAGDIGVHFPATDPKWRGADSALFVEFAARAVRARRGMISHIAVNLICESPKIDSHRETMAKRIGEIASIGMDRVAVSATTTEGLGFTGRGEGIAARATATVRLPLSPE